MTCALNPLNLTTADLAPADLRSHEFDFTGFSCSHITSSTHPRFTNAYAALWAEFGDANEMEQPNVIAGRMAWRPQERFGKYAMQYTMTAVLQGDQLAAVRDHTAIINLDDTIQPAIVHLSHVLIHERYRGTGLAGWMRALPLRTARDCLARLGQPNRPITLVAEMEPPDPTSIARMRRLAAYENVGFLKIDPQAVTYHQPDFRPAAAIDAAGAPSPVPLVLIVRRVGREQELTMDGGDVRAMVAALHAMYARSLRAADMAAVQTDQLHLPAPGTPVALRRPTR